MRERDDDKRLNESLEKLDRILRRMEKRQAKVEQRVVDLYQTAFIALAVIVISIALLVVILSRQLPSMTSTIVAMNAHFTNVADDMARMDGTIQKMHRGMDSLPVIITHVDRVHGDVGSMIHDIDMVGDSFGYIDHRMVDMSTSVGDMRNSFQHMEYTVDYMGRDINDMSQPMRLFNKMNPFW